MAGFCYNVVISVGSTDRSASDDGFVYFDFVGCDGIPVTIGYNVNKTSFNTGYCMDVSYLYECYIYVSGVKTSCSASSIAQGPACSGSTPVEPPPVVIPPAYGIKYRLQAISKSGLTYTCDILEKLYTGPIYNIATGDSPFVVDVLASSDDPFQAILPSTLTIRADFTGFTGPWPDFLTTDDRKYHVKLYASGITDYVWRGFILMDSLTIPFTTGRTIVDIICVDGIGLLKSVPYLPSTGDINISENLLKIVNNCLQYLLYPDGYNINIAVNYYTSQLAEANSYFRQAYVLPNTWTTSDNSYLSCYDILEIICTGHAAQMYQANGKWCISSVNERAADTIRTYSTDQDLVADTLSSQSISYTIKPYVSDSVTPFYFVDNSQSKVLAKCYQKIEITADADYAKNTIDNGTLSKVTGSYPTNWTVTLGSGATFLPDFINGDIPAWILTGGTSGVSTVQANSCGYVTISDVIELSFLLASLTTTTPAAYVEIKIDVGSGNNYKFKRVLGGQPEWKYNFVSGYYEVDSFIGSKTINITTISAPASGTLYITFMANPTDQITIANVKKTGNSYINKTVASNQNTTSPYKKEQTVKIGGPQPYNVNSQSQSILTTSGNQLVNYYRYGSGSVYTSLYLLVLSQYYNILSKTRVNMSFTQYGIYDAANSRLISINNSFYIQDTSGTVSLSGLKFVLGSSRFDYINNTIQGTALQVSNTVLPLTILINQVS